MTTKCTKCSHDGVVIGEEPVIVNVFRDGKMRMEEGHPLGMLVCEKCGHVDFYSIKVINKNRRLNDERNENV